jgi:hypothetical protein
MTARWRNAFNLTRQSSSDIDLKKPEKKPSAPFHRWTDLVM